MAPAKRATTGVKPAVQNIKTVDESIAPSTTASENASGDTLTLSMLSYEKLPPLQHAIESYNWHELVTTTTLPRTDRSPIEFRLPGVDRHFTDLFGGWLWFAVKVYRETAPGQLTTLAYNEKVTPIDLFGLTFWSHVELVISDLLFLGNYQEYAYMTHTNLTLYGSDHDKQFAMQNWGYFPDTPSKFDDVTVPAPTGTYPLPLYNVGAAERHKLIEESRECQFIVPFVTDCITTHKFIPNNTDILLRYVRNTNEFALQTSSGNNYNYAIQITSAKFLFMRYLLTDHEFALQHRILSNNQYNISATQMVYKRKTFQPGEQNLSYIPWYGILPFTIGITMVKTKAVNGSLKNNPFLNEFFGMIRCTIYKNDVAYPLSNGLIINRDDTFYTLPYFYLQRNLYQGNLNFTSAHMNQGLGYLVFDMTKGHTANSPFDSETEHGNIRIQIDLAGGLAESITMFTFGLFRKQILVDQNRKFTLVDTIRK